MTAEKFYSGADTIEMIADVDKNNLLYRIKVYDKVNKADFLSKANQMLGQILLMFEDGRTVDVVFREITGQSQRPWKIEDIKYEIEYFIEIHPNSYLAEESYQNIFKGCLDDRNVSPFFVNKENPLDFFEYIMKIEQSALDNYLCSAGSARFSTLRHLPKISLMFENKEEPFLYWDNDQLIIKRVLQLAESKGWNDPALIESIKTAKEDGNMQELKDFINHPEITKPTLFLNLTMK